MEIDRKELKRQARECMALTDPKFWVVALVYIAMTTGVSWLLSFLPIPHTQTSLIFFQVLLMLYSTVVQFGLCLWALWTYRQLDPDTGALTQGFSVAGQVVLMKLGIYIRVMGWYFLVALCLTVPFTAVAATLKSDSMITLLSILFIASLLISLVVFSLRYALAPYLLADQPDGGSVQPIRRSASLMRGWKWQLFKLEFSFIGWAAVNFILSAAVILAFLAQAGLLAPGAIQDPEWYDTCINVIYSTPVVILSTLVTIPVSLWLIPYQATARAGFYDARLLAASHEAQMPEMPPL